MEKKMFVDGSNAYCTGRGALRATNFILLSNYLLILIILGHNHNLLVTNLIQTFLGLDTPLFQNIFFYSYFRL